MGNYKLKAYLQRRSQRIFFSYLIYKFLCILFILISSTSFTNAQKSDLDANGGMEDNMRKFSERLFFIHLY